MTTTNRRRFGGSQPRLTGKHMLHMLAGGLAMLLAATFVPGYAQEAKAAKAAKEAKEAKAAASSSKEAKAADGSSSDIEMARSGKTGKAQPGAAELKKGLAAWEDEEFEDAFEYFEAGAEKGNTDAMIMLSYCLDEGIGTDEDEDEAHEWMKKAADAGNAYAQGAYGIILFVDGKEKSALRYLKKSVEQGCPFGIVVLGRLYIDDADTAKEGFDCFMQVAGMSPSKEKIIMDYWDVEDLLGDFGSRKVSFSQAVIYRAQFMVGMAYYAGRGVRKDLNEAKKWLRMAAKGGLVDALNALDELDEADDEDPDDDEDEDEEEVKPASKDAGLAEYRKGVAAVEEEEFMDAAEYFLSGAKKGNPEAMAMYGICLYDGKGVKKNPAEGIKWLKKAADTGNADTQALYGSMLIAMDEIDEAIKYLNKSATRDCILGQYMLVSAIGARIDDDNPDQAEVNMMLNQLKKVAGLPLSTEKDFFDDLESLSPMLQKLMDVPGMELKLPRGKQTVSNTLIVLSQTSCGLACMGQKQFDEARKWLRKAGKNGLIQAEAYLEVLEDFENESTSGEEE